MRRHDGEHSKYNNQQGIHNHWTCQYNASVSCHLQDRAVAPARGGGRNPPVKTAALSELPSTPDTCIRPEELIGGMPLSPIGCRVENKLSVDGPNEVDTRSCGCYHLCVLSARRCHIINPGRFLTGGTPVARRGGIGALLLQDRSPSTA